MFLIDHILKIMTDVTFSPWKSKNFIKYNDKNLNFVVICFLFFFINPILVTTSALNLLRRINTKIIFYLFFIKLFFVWLFWGGIFLQLKIHFLISFIIFCSVKHVMCMYMKYLKVLHHDLVSTYVERGVTEALSPPKVVFFNCWV